MPEAQMMPMPTNTIGVGTSPQKIMPAKWRYGNQLPVAKGFHHQEVRDHESAGTGHKPVQVFKAQCMPTADDG